MLPVIHDLLIGMSMRHYHEPFLGGGAVFFSIQPNLRSYLSDTNEDLINTYICIRDNVERVIEILKEYENSETEYYRLRDNKADSSVERAAQFLFLNHTSFNGIYRVNKQGRYNVPYGGRAWECDTSILRNASMKLKNTNIKTCDFERNKKNIAAGDLVFLDPPYTVTHNNNGFIKYNQKLFSIEDQIRLSKYIDFVKRKDAFYILTNAAHIRIEEIFEKGDTKIELNRKSLVGGRNAKRDNVSEYLFTNIPVR